MYLYFFSKLLEYHELSELVFPGKQYFCCIYIVSKHINSGSLQTVAHSAVYAIALVAAWNAWLVSTLITITIVQRAVIIAVIVKKMIGALIVLLDTMLTLLDHVKV